MSYDQKCYDLAEAFLSDIEDPVIHDHAHALAQEIANTISDFMEEIEGGHRCSHCGYDGYFIMVHHIDCPNRKEVQP